MKSEEIITKIQDDINRFIKYHVDSEEERKILGNIFDDVEKLREKEILYIIPLPFLITTDSKQQYLTFKDNTWFASRKDRNLKQVWNERELRTIPKEYLKYAIEIEE